MQTVIPSHIIAVKPDNLSTDKDIPSYIWDALYERSELPLSKIEPLSTDTDISVAAIGTPRSTGKELDRVNTSPKDLRNLMWLLYFHRVIPLSPPQYDFTCQLSKIIPFIVPFKRVNLIIPTGVMRDHDALLSILPYGVVGLASKDVAADCSFKV